MAIKEEIRNGKKVFTAFVDGSDARGKRIQMKRRGLLSKRQAEAAEFELKRQLANLKGEAPSYTWDEWFDICVERMKIEYKATTILNYTAKNTHWILPFWKGREIASLTPQDVHDVVYNAAKNVSWHTRRSTLKYVKRILAMAIEEGLITRNPALAVKVKVPQAKQSVLNKTEVDVLLKEAKALNHRFYDVWVLALLTGMRSGELYALRWTDIDFEGDRVHIVRAWNSKNGFGETKSAKHRVVPMSGELKRHLMALKVRQDHGTEFVLPRLDEWAVGVQAQVLRDFCEGVGITSVKFHDLRATFITRLLGQGVPLAVVMAIVGHSQIKTTQAYLRLAGLELKGATDRLEIELPEESATAKVFEFSR